MIQKRQPDLIKIGLFGRPEFGGLDGEGCPDFCSSRGLNRIARDHTIAVHNLDADLPVNVFGKKHFVMEALLINLVGIRSRLNRYGGQWLEPNRLPDARHAIVVDRPTRRTGLLATGLRP